MTASRGFSANILRLRNAYRAPARSCIHQARLELKSAPSRMRLGMRPACLVIVTKCQAAKYENAPDSGLAKHSTRFDLVVAGMTHASISGHPTRLQLLDRRRY
jgi:hypothetical protein